MFQTTDRDELLEVLNAFQIAMYAVEPDARGRMICAGQNDLAKTLSGYQDRDVIGKPLDTFMHKRDADRATGHFTQCISTRRPVHDAFEVQFPNGMITLVSTVVPVFGPDGGILRLIGNSVGLKIHGDVKYERLLDEVTQLSAEGASSLFDALRAIEVRRTQGDISPEEDQFLGVFSQLAERALKHSLAIRDRVLETARTQDPQRHLLHESALSKAIADLTLTD